MAINESLKKYIKKFYNLDVDGDSVSEIFQKFLEKKYSVFVDAGDNLSEMFEKVISENDSLPDSGDSSTDEEELLNNSVCPLCREVLESIDVEEVSKALGASYYDGEDSPVYQDKAAYVSLFAYVSPEIYGNAENIPERAMIFVILPGSSENWGWARYIWRHYAIDISISIELDTEDPQLVVGECTVTDLNNH